MNNEDDEKKITATVRVSGLDDLKDAIQRAQYHAVRLKKVLVQIQDAVEKSEALDD